jgi:uncharacterized membrane protein
MANDMISPNLHVVFIHYPLGLLIAGVVIELFSFLWPRSGVRAAGKWMILLGALSAVPATFSGLYALRDIAATNNSVDADDAPWVDVRAGSPLLSQPGAWKMLEQHLILESVATGLSALVVVVWLGCSDRARQLIRVPMLVLLLGSIGAMLLGAWNGGEAVYRHSAGVQIQGETSALRSFSVLELHVIGAGLMVAIVLAAVGMSVRKITVKHEIIQDVSELPAEQKTAAEGGLRTPASSMAMLRSFNPGIELTVAPFAPASRFWLLAGILAIATAAGGVFILVRGSDALATVARTHEPVVKFLWEQVKPDKGQTVNRPSGHVAAGATIILLALILAAVVHYAPRQRFWMGFLTFVLLGVVGGQIWLGILLLFDTPVGSIGGFNATQNPPVKTAAR